jgi:hypothetical protein
MGFGRSGQALAERIMPRIQVLLDQFLLEPCSSGVRLSTKISEPSFVAAEMPTVPVF